MKLFEDNRNPDLMKCPFCESDDIYTEHNVGYDIWPDEDKKDVVEEKQHRDVCQNCNAWRFRFEPISMRDGPLPITVGDWREYNPDENRWMGW